MEICWNNYWTSPTAKGGFTSMKDSLLNISETKEETNFNVSRTMLLEFKDKLMSE